VIQVQRNSPKQSEYSDSTSSATPMIVSWMPAAFLSLSTTMYVF
jgi:hypothetical protein